MWSAFWLAVADAFAPPSRRALVLTFTGTVVLLAALWIGASLLLSAFHFTGISWLDLAIHLLGGLASLFIAWLLFPATTALILSFFLDSVLSALEAQHYPRLPPPRRIGRHEAIVSGLRLGLLSVALNLLALPLYLLLPVANLALFYGLNGYLVGREYFVAVAARRLDRPAARKLWQRFRVRLVAAGIVIAALLSIPIVGFIAPVIGIAFMLHLFEQLRAAAGEASHHVERAEP